MQVSWLTCESNAWRRALTRLLHDVFHQPAYVRLMARHEGGEGRALLVEEGNAILLLPLLGSLGIFALGFMLTPIAVGTLWALAYYTGRQPQTNGAKSG